jgi:hypothetical protein
MNMNRKALRALALCLILTGCAAGEFGPRDGAGFKKHVRLNDQTCDAAVCNIDVRVVCDSSSCLGVVDPKVLLIFRAGGPKQIHWHLKGAPGYAFADEKVDLDPSEFSCLAPGANQVLVVCKDEFRQAKTEAYEYHLKVIKRSDGSVLTIDPWIVPR